MPPHRPIFDAQDALTQIDRYVNVFTYRHSPLFKDVKQRDSLAKSIEVEYGKKYSELFVSRTDELFKQYQSIPSAAESRELEKAASRLAKVNTYVSLFTQASSPFFGNVKRRDEIKKMIKSECGEDYARLFVFKTKRFLPKRHLMTSTL